jgi:hypothetical protein
MRNGGGCGRQRFFRGAGILAAAMAIGWAALPAGAADEPPPAAAGEPGAAESPDLCPPPETGWLTRGEKALILNAGGVAGILAYGLLNWDYGEESFNFRNEHWFQRDTKEGGMDKLGHFWSSYAFAHLLSHVYHRWGYAESDANLYGALSSFGLQSAMELMDGFSRYGVSYEDFLMNTAGAAAGYLWGRYPALKKMIDFRMEYIPSFDADDLDPFTNYRDQKYLLALKAEGFEFLEQPVLEYLELHLGYYARGYEEFEESDPQDHRRRYGFVGIGINVTNLLRSFLDLTLFDYLQVPYTAIHLELNFD